MVVTSVIWHVVQMHERLHLNDGGVCVLQVLSMNKEINPVELDFLLRFPCVPNVTSPVDFLYFNTIRDVRNYGIVSHKSKKQLIRFRLSK